MSFRRKPATYADIEALPEHLVGEIIDDELVVSPRPGPRHAHAASILGGDLIGPYHRGKGGPGGWWILDEPELHLDRDVLVPDLAGWRRERMPALPEAAFFTLPPDWVCEVLSPSTAPIDRGRKQRIYAREGVGHLWFVDPGVRTIEVLRLESGRWMVAAAGGAEDILRLEPFPELPIELGALWGDPAPAG